MTGAVAPAPILRDRTRALHLAGSVRAISRRDANGTRVANADAEGERPMILVQDIMTAWALVVQASATVADARERLLAHRVSGAPVLDAGHLVGVVSKTDLLKHADDVEVRAVMTPHVKFVRPTDPAQTAIDLMLEARVHRLIVLAGPDRVTGIVTTVDVLRAVQRGDQLHVPPAWPHADPAVAIAEEGGFWTSQRDVRAKPPDKPETPMTKAIPTIQKWMSTNPITISKHARLDEAHAAMRAEKIRHLPVVEGEHLVGILSLGDLHLIETLRGVDVKQAMVEDAMTAKPYTVCAERGHRRGRRRDGRAEDRPRRSSRRTARSSASSPPSTRSARSPSSSRAALTH